MESHSPLKSNTDFEISVGTLANIADVVELYIQSWVKTYKSLVSENLLLSLTHESLAKKFYNAFETPGRDDFFLIASDRKSKRFLGFIKGGRCTRTEQIQDSGELFSMHVFPEFQGVGIGTSLFREGREALIKYQYKTGYLSVAAKNVRAWKMYEKQGWQFAYYYCAESAPNTKIVRMFNRFEKKINF